MHDTSHFSNYCLQTLFHLITIPVGQKFTYTVPLNILQNPENYVMALEGSDRLIDIMGESKEISQDLRKIIVDVHKSGSSLGAISKRLKVPRSSVQTIVCKYKHHVLSPRDERTLV